MSVETETKASSPPPDPVAGRKRPRIDLSSSLGRRGGPKSMFGVVLGTLNKAKTSEEQSRKSEAAKKRAEIDERLATKLKAEQDHMRKGEEAKKEKVGATRREEELILKDTIYKQRLHRLPLLANFLITTDDIKDPEEEEEMQIPTEDTDMADPSATKLPPKGPKSDNVLRSVQAPRRHPPPIYYLPRKLLPVQEKFINRRKEEVQKSIQAEYDNWKSEKEKSIEEINEMRKHSTQALDDLKESTQDEAGEEGEGDEEEDLDDVGRSKKRRKTMEGTEDTDKKDEEGSMVVDEEKELIEREEEGVDAVEY